MTNERTARMFGDPPFRHLAYADDLAAIERDRAEQQERIDADPDWRTDLMRKREALRGKPRRKRTAVREMVSAE